jgi:hypothetical protein
MVMQHQVITEDSMTLNFFVTDVSQNYASTQLQHLLLTVSGHMLIYNRHGDSASMDEC